MPQSLKCTGYIIKFYLAMVVKSNTKIVNVDLDENDQDIQHF